MNFQNVVLLFCASLLGCSHTPTPQEKQHFTEELNTMKLLAPKSFGVSKYSRIPLKAGQWVSVLTQMKDEKQGLSLSKFKVLKVSGKTVVMEVESINSNSPTKSIMQYEVENFPMYNKLSVTKSELEKYIENIKIKKVITKFGDKAPTVIPQELIDMSKGYVKSLFLTGYRTQEPKMQDCNSDYIKAKKCLVYDFEANVLGQSMVGKSFAHSDIPIMSFIKSDSDRAITQVINYGLDGAKTSL